MLNSVKDKLKIEIPDDPDIEEEPKEYVRIYGIHNLLRRLWDVDRKYVGGKVVDFDRMRHHAVITYSVRQLAVNGEEEQDDDEIVKIYDPGCNVQVKSEIHTEIVPDADKFYTIINEFYKHRDWHYPKALFDRLIGEGYISNMPNELLAIADIEWDETASVDDDMRTIRGSYGYSFVNESEVKSLNEILDMRDTFKSNFESVGKILDIDISWVNHYCYIDHGKCETIYGPFYVQPESVLKAIKSQSHTGLFERIAKLFKKEK